MDRALAFFKSATFVVVLTLLAVVTWRLATSDFSPISFEFAELLSVLLALFAVGLSSAFYFKTTETSNRFYENSFRFTKDISETLGRIEERFGERLRHIDENYSGLRDQLSPGSIAASAAEEIEDERESLEAIVKEREEVIANLFERAHITGSEKERIEEQLRDTEKELEDAKDQIAFLRRQYRKAKKSQDRPARRHFDRPAGGPDYYALARRWIRDMVAEKGLEKAPVPLVLQELQRAVEGEAPRSVVSRLMSSGWFSHERGWSDEGQSEISRARARVRVQNRAGQSEGGEGASSQ